MNGTQHQSLNVNTLLTVGALVAGAYIISQIINLGKGAKQAATAAAQAVSTTLVPHPTATAQIVLDDGTSIPYSAANWTGPGSLCWWTNSCAGQFSYNGKNYQLTDLTADETNTYYALTVGS